MALIIFDYDGVLADTFEDLIQSGQEACNRLGIRHTVVDNDLRELEAMSFVTFGKACGAPDHLIEEFVEICLKFLSTKESPPAIFTGMSEVVKHFSIRHKIAIATTNSSQNVRAFLAHHGLDTLVHAVYGVDTPGSKAHKISLARERFHEESVFMIGDSLSDVRAAKEAGVTSIAVTWGHQALGMLLRGEPDYVVNNPQKLFQIIEQ